ncbi:MAG: SAM-dependent methyltransferase [Candidatus Omnitrophota bacterium]|jgi:hypothetical protein|nr:MAG: SAM-dependent methyltransferase [Candidatus Omnitrophota bacterium]
MRILNPAQEVFLRSAIRNALHNHGELLHLTVVEAKTNQTIFHASIREGTHCRIETCQNPESASTCLSDEIPDRLLTAMRDTGKTVLIDDGRQVLRLDFKGNAMTRETLPSRTDVLKSARWAVGKATHLDPNEAAPLLQAIGIMTADGDIKAPMRKKFKQVNHFLDLIAPILREKCDSAPFVVVDCGCGKSYLGFVLFWYLKNTLKRPASFIGIDQSENVIETSRERTKQLAMKDMQFYCSSIREARLPNPIGLLVSLHACDTATDEAIACGVVHQARHIVVAPCCQHELADQIEGAPMYPLKKHGIFKQRFGDLLTDMVRALFLEVNGYTVTTGEFIGVEETPKNLLLKAKAGNAAGRKRAREYEAFKQFYKITPSIDHLKREMEYQRQNP